ncbi:MAG: hypothetical protein EOM64_07025 [Erysipelotrichia bacterium]|nr:hypothetical protein [Erysipelotrichia bacterium]
MQISVIQAILLGVFCTLISTGAFPLGWISMNIMAKPLIACGIIGLIMGNVKDALIIGCVLQSAYIGQMSIGGVTTLPDISMAVWFALPLTLTTNGDATTCLTICLAFAAVATVIKEFGNMFKIAFLHRQDALIEKGQIHKAWWYPWLGHIWTVAICMVIVPLFCLAGGGVVNSIVAMLPPAVSAIMKIFVSLLPAIGFMILMVTLIHNNWQWIYFIVGFVMSASLGWNTIAITAFACLIAYMIFQFTPDKGSSVLAKEEDD